MYTFDGIKLAPHLIRFRKKEHIELRQIEVVQILLCLFYGKIEIKIKIYDKKSTRSYEKLRYEYAEIKVPK